jgi:predicted transcriptional regulator
MMKDIVIKTLKAAKKPLRPGEIAEMAGISKNDAEKAISELKKEDKIYSPKRCFYDIKK